MDVHDFNNKKFAKDLLHKIKTSFRRAMYLQHQIEEYGKDNPHLAPIPGLPPTDDIVQWYNALDPDHKLRSYEPKLEDYMTIEELNEDEAKNRFNNDLLSHIKTQFRSGLYMDQLKDEGYDENPPPGLPSTDYILNWYYDLDTNHELRRDEPKLKDYIIPKETYHQQPPRRGPHPLVSFTLGILSTIVISYPFWRLKNSKC